MPTPLAGPRQALIEAMQGRLGFALLTSVGLHLAVFATLMPFGARPQGGVDSSRQGVDSQMKVVLAPTREDAPAARNDARPPPASLPERRVADAREAARAVRRKSENAASAGGPLAPRVIVSDAVPRARLGEHVEQYMLRAFPVEIEEPVRIKSSLRVLFPSTAQYVGDVPDH